MNKKGWGGNNPLVYYKKRLTACSASLKVSFSLFSIHPIITHTVPEAGGLSVQFLHWNRGNKQKLSKN